MKKNIPYLMLLVIALALLGQRGAQAQIVVSRSVLGSGGAVLSDSSYRIVGTVGQPFVGVAQNPSNVNSVGFWYLASLGIVAEIEEALKTVPEKYRLRQNYPNPFNPETKIEFQLPEASHVIIKIFNVLGQEIRTLTDKQYQAGYHKVRWDGRDRNGNSVSSGVYLYKLKAGEFQQVKKMSLLR